MSELDPTPTLAVRPPYPTRFGWGMRLFLCVLLFAMVFRSFSVLWPTSEWADKLDMRIMPRRLPTRAELNALSAQASEESPNPVREEVLLALDSVWEFFHPWPDPAARARIRTWPDFGRWTLVWLTSRLEFCENLVGFNEEWPMFSPSVARRKWVARARLQYADGSERIVRGLSDPEDLTRYGHWWEEKILDHELKVKEGKSRSSDNFGYCNLLLHRYPKSETGASLQTISLFVVRYDLAPPGVDAYEWLRNQTGPPAKQVYADFYRFDVRTRQGTCLIDRYDD